MVGVVYNGLVRVADDLDGVVGAAGDVARHRPVVRSRVGHVSCS